MHPDRQERFEWGRVSAQPNRSSVFYSISDASHFHVEALGLPALFNMPPFGIPLWRSIAQQALGSPHVQTYAAGRGTSSLTMVIDGRAPAASWL